MEPVRERLYGPRPLLADGAMGTLLFERGLPPGRPPEAMNLDRPEVLEDVARAYLDAGADIVSTNTFGGSPLKLALHGLEDRMAEINAAAVAAARRAAGRNAYVAGSCGPTGRLLRPFGDVDAEEVARGFDEQVRVLVDAGIDMLFVETMTDLTEASLAVRAARSIAPELPIAACMTFDRTPRGFFTIMGVDIPTAAEALAEAGADLVGSNCGHGMKDMVEIAGEFARQARRPVIIQSNAGLPQQIGSRLVYGETPESMAEAAGALLKTGVAILGGCCGTTPEHIRRLRQLLDSG